MPHPLFFYNTLTRQKEKFVPLDPQCVRLYVCGPTVYQRPHIGNARSNVVFDGIYRLLQHLYPCVLYTRNFTDIDDKIIHQSEKTGHSIETITNTVIDEFHQDMRSLSVLTPTHQPRATAHIPMILSLIQKLIKDKYAYTRQGHVWFDTQAYPAYGHFRRGDDSEPDSRKKHPYDFVLWKPSTGSMPGWDSPWGYGRPGWHIECSAMAHHYLGEQFDIHGGGTDLEFPHHENEIAQSCAAFGTPFLAHTWLHNGLLHIDDKKMAKSLGNTITVYDLLNRGIPGPVIRWAMFSTHYRHPLVWKDELVQQSHTCVKRLLSALETTEQKPTATQVHPDILKALTDDFNTPAALQTLLKMTEDDSHNPELLASSAALLGFEPFPPLSKEKIADIEDSIALRLTLRKDKNFDQADRIRENLYKHGIGLQDHANGTTSWMQLYPKL